MKKKEESAVLLLFCAGLLAGMLLPKWTFINIELGAEVLSSGSFQKFLVTSINYGQILERVAFLRLGAMFLLYFACYCAAGFWILAAAFLAVGVSAGFLGALSVAKLNYWGILFWGCVLFPQWLLYGWAGRRMVQFMEKRRMRTMLCSGNAVPSYNWKVFFEFLKILGMTLCGIGAETYLNPAIMRCFFSLYLAKK